MYILPLTPVLTVNCKNCKTQPNDRRAEIGTFFAC